LGYSSQDLLGMNLKDFIHEDDRNKVTEIWNRGKNKNKRNIQ
jgi:PAS domain S-box-containing protein